MKLPNSRRARKRSCKVRWRCMGRRMYWDEGERQRLLHIAPDVVASPGTNDRMTLADIHIIDMGGQYDRNGLGPCQ
jgi:hypothetical protein